MTLFKDKFRIEPARLPAMDYGSSASYMVTICVAEKVPAFGEVIRIENPAFHPWMVAPPYLAWSVSGTERQSIAALQFTKLGQAAYEFWMRIPEFHPFIDLDAFVVMPDHVHGILHFDKEGAGTGLNHFGPQKQNLASVIRGYKSGLTMLSQELKIPFKWQSRYYDTVIRNDDHLSEAREYILSNPERNLLKKANVEPPYLAAPQP